MTHRYDILARAGNENGPVITLAKAAHIVASGGRVVTCAVDIDGANVWGMQARVSGGSAWQAKEPEVSWSSLSTTTPEEALLHAAVVKAAAQIGQDARDTTSQFNAVPPWVREGANATSLNAVTDETLISKAAHRYHAGDVTVKAAWEFACDDARADAVIARRPVHDPRCDRDLCHPDCTIRRQAREDDHR